MVHKTAIIEKKESLQSVCAFQSAKDPVTGAPINLSFDCSEFSRAKDEEEALFLFKFCAQEEMNKPGISLEDKVRLSLQYQVLCNETAMVGSVKQKVANSNQLKDLGTHAFGLNTVKLDQYQPQSMAEMPSAVAPSRQSAPLFKGAMKLQAKSSRGAGDPEDVLESMLP